MSSRDWKFRIHDVLHGIEKVQLFSKGMTFNQFKANELVLDAFVRNLEIIGEASRGIPSTIKRLHSDILNRIKTCNFERVESRGFDALKIASFNPVEYIPWEDMNGMRNILIHEYFGVDIKIVWHTVKKSLPVLHKQLQQLVQK